MMFGYAAGRTATLTGPPRVGFVKLATYIESYIQPVPSPTTCVVEQPGALLHRDLHSPI